MWQSSESYDVFLLGGGIIGLSLAWELAQHGAQVCVADSREMGREASWAAAGMLPPGPREENWPDCHALEQLAGLSERLHRGWHEKLADLTGIDNGYGLTGAIYLADATLAERCKAWAKWGIAYHRLEAPALADFEPQMSPIAEGIFLPSEAQLHPPRHLQALEAACVKSGVTLKPDCPISGFEKSGNRISKALTSTTPISADHYCLTAGCWTEQFGTDLGLELPTKPVRGQIVQLSGPAGVLQRIINKGPHYLMPRSDGTILVGSTEEDVGFDQRTTGEAREELLRFAHNLCPRLREFQVDKHWAGLRPATPDELPYLGRLSHWENAWIAAGHFRSGIQLSTGTAVVLRSLILGQVPQVDVAELGVERLPGQG